MREKIGTIIAKKQIPKYHVSAAIAPNLARDNTSGIVAKRKSIPKIVSC